MGYPTKKQSFYKEKKTAFLSSTPNFFGLSCFEAALDNLELCIVIYFVSTRTPQWLILENKTWKIVSFRKTKLKTFEKLFWFLRINQKVSYKFCTTSAFCFFKFIWWFERQRSDFDFFFKSKGHIVCQKGLGLSKQFPNSILNFRSLCERPIGNWPTTWTLGVNWLLGKHCKLKLKLRRDD